MYTHPSSAIAAIESATPDTPIFIEMVDGSSYMITESYLEGKIVCCTVRRLEKDSSFAWQGKVTAGLCSFWQSQTRERLGYQLILKRQEGPRIIFLLDRLTILSFPDWFRVMLSKISAEILVTE